MAHKHPTAEAKLRLKQKRRQGTSPPHWAQAHWFKGRKRFLKTNVNYLALVCSFITVSEKCCNYARLCRSHQDKADLRWETIEVLGKFLKQCLWAMGFLTPLMIHSVPPAQCLLWATMQMDLRRIWPQAGPSGLPKITIIATVVESIYASDPLPFPSSILSIMDFPRDPNP